MEMVTEHERGGFSNIIESGSKSGINDEPPMRTNYRRVKYLGISWIDDGLFAFDSSIREAELANNATLESTSRICKRHHNDFGSEREADCKMEAHENEQKERAYTEWLKAMVHFAISFVKNATQK